MAIDILLSPARAQADSLGQIAAGAGSQQTDAGYGSYQEYQQPDSQQQQEYRQDQGTGSFTNQTANTHTPADQSPQPTAVQGQLNDAEDAAQGNPRPGAEATQSYSQAANLSLAQHANSYSLPVGSLQHGAAPIKYLHPATPGQNISALTATQSSPLHSQLQGMYQSSQSTTADLTNAGSAGATGMLPALSAGATGIQPALSAEQALAQPGNQTTANTTVTTQATTSPGFTAIAMDAPRSEQSSLMPTSSLPQGMQTDSSMLMRSMQESAGAQQLMQQFAQVSGNADTAAIEGVQSSRHQVSQWGPLPLTPSAQSPQHARELLQPLRDQLRFQIDQQIQKAELRLDPPDMGKIELNIRLDGDRLHIQMHAANNHIRDALQSGLERLRAELAQDHQGDIQLDIGQQGQQGEKHSGRQDEASAILTAIHESPAAAEVRHVSADLNLLA